MAIAPPPQPDGTKAPKPFSTDELINQDTREFMLMAGKDGSGKSCAIVSIAKFVETVLNPEAKFYVIDMENKFRTALKSYGADAPRNIEMYKCDNINDVTNSTEAIMAKRKEGDWFAAESMSRIWDKAQDMGYLHLSGYDKLQYLEIRRTKAKQAPTVPNPDMFWNMVKGAHDGSFLDLLSQATTLNVVLSTTVAKPPRDGAARTNKTRDEVRAEFGIDVGIDGAPRLPYYAETFLLLDMANGKGRCRVIRDNPSPNRDTRPEFEIEDRTMFAMNFWSKCRG